MQFVATSDPMVWSVCLSISLSVTCLHPAKMVKSVWTEGLFGLETQVGNQGTLR